MKITTLLKLFKKTLPYYERVVKENYNNDQLLEANLCNGLCYFVLKTFKKESLYFLFDSKGYYKNYIIKNTNNICSGYIAQIGAYTYDNKIELCIKPRMIFLQEQIIELQKLLDKGYTHV